MGQAESKLQPLAIDVGLIHVPFRRYHLHLKAFLFQRFVLDVSEFLMEEKRPFVYDDLPVFYADGQIHKALFRAYPREKVFCAVIETEPAGGLLVAERINCEYAYFRSVG